MSLFISYSHVESYKNSLNRIFKELNFLFAKEQVLWIDRNMLAGDNLDVEIKKGIEQCDYFLIFFCNDYLTSDYIRSKELVWMFEKYNHDNSKLAKFIIPVMLQDTNWNLVTDHKELKYFVKGEHGEPVFCAEKKPVLSSLFDIKFDEWNTASREIGEKMKRNFSDVTDKSLPVNLDNTEIRKLIEKRFKCDRKIPYEEFSLQLPRMKEIKKDDHNQIDKSMMFFIGSSYHLLNNFLYFIPSKFEQDFTNFKIYCNLLSQTDIINPNFEDKPIPVKNTTDVSKSYSRIFYEIEKTFKDKSLKDKNFSNAESVIIPLFLRFEQEIVYADSLFEKIKSEMHSTVCQKIPEIAELHLKKIHYFICIIYEESSLNPDFVKQLQSIINGCTNDADVFVINEFEKINEKHLGKWLDQFQGEMDISKIKDRILKVCCNGEITMKEFDDFMLNQKYSN